MEVRKGWMRIKAAAVVHLCQIFTGHRHVDAVRKAVKATNVRPVRGAQGFITECGEFLDREQAALHAFGSGQIKEKKRYLYSEDLY